jgi:hypothetical protein
MAKALKAPAKTRKFTRKLALKFCDLCDDAHQVWQFHRSLFDDTKHERWLWKSPARHALGALASITRAHSLLQLAKLHDPSSTMGHPNLTINYVVEHKGWPAAVRKELFRLKEDLDAFALRFEFARNKTLCHNDLDAVMSGKRLGRFPTGIDLPYFDTLLEFAGLVFKTKWKGDTYPFSRVQAQRNASELVGMLKAAPRAQSYTEVERDAGELLAMLKVVPRA